MVRPLTTSTPTPFPTPKPIPTLLPHPPPELISETGTKMWGNVSVFIIQGAFRNETVQILGLELFVQPRQRKCAHREMRGGETKSITE
jgi:hypothetical protein